MIIGVMVLDLLYENSSSLKDKRHVVSSIKERLRHKFNISVIESDYQDLWQKIQIAAVTVSNSRQIVDRTFGQIEKFIFSHYPVRSLEIHKEYV
jgi:uncharacterized protein YlxP (DUF503 family)